MIVPTALELLHAAKAAAWEAAEENAVSTEVLRNSARHRLLECSVFSSEKGLLVYTTWAQPLGGSYEVHHCREIPLPL
jgi:hypothetical protein